MPYRQLEARLYEGRQEGGLHRSIVARIVEMAKADPRIALGSIRHGEYLADVSGNARGRFPDVRFDNGEASFAFEVQLSPITIERIVERSAFYRSQGRVLVWVHWCFDPDLHRAAWYWDLIGSTRSYITYSIDRALQDASIAARRFQLEQVRFRHATGRFERETVDLSRIAADAVVGDPQRWAIDFRKRWASRFVSTLDYASARSLVSEAIDRSGSSPKSVEASEQLVDVINTLIAIEAGTVVGKSSANLPSQINSHLNSLHAGPIAVAAVEALLKRYRPDILSGQAAHARSVPDHIARAKSRAEQRAADPELRRLKGLVSTIVATLFP